MGTTREKGGSSRSREEEGEEEGSRGKQREKIEGRLKERKVKCRDSGVCQGIARHHKLSQGSHSKYLAYAIKQVKLPPTPAPSSSAAPPTLGHSCLRK